MIDSHQHFWKFDPVRDSWITEEMNVIRRDFYPEDLKPLLDKNGIEGCVAVQAVQSEEETTFLHTLAQANGFIRGVVGWADLRAPDLQEKLSELKSLRKLKGFRHVIQGEPSGFMGDRKFIEGVKRLGDFGYTYDLLIYHHQLKEALTFVHQLQDVKIVVDHIAKPSIRTKEKTDWELSMAAMATYKNVYCKISGMVTEADWRNWKTEDFVPYLDEVFESFGTDRIMYGSDWPVCLVSARYEQQLGIIQSYISNLSPDEKHKVMHENAVRFYNL